MIIWINGPFGVGKTQTAFELRYQIKGAIIFDPETVGYFIRKIIPPNGGQSDFQDYPVWRSSVSGLLRQLQTDKDQVVIVPMTVVSPHYYAEITAPLIADQIKVKHYTLMASKATIQARLKKRFDAKSWNYQQIDRCLAGLANPVFGNYINTDANNLYQVVKHICGDNQFDFRGNDSRPRRWLRRLAVVIKSIRV